MARYPNVKKVNSVSGQLSGSQTFCIGKGGYTMQALAGHASMIERPLVKPWETPFQRYTNAF